MPKFRKKPVVIEAMQLTEESVNEVYLWMECTKGMATDDEGKPILTIPTLEGPMTASCGDWIIKGVNGEYYPCKPDIFRKTYEPADAKPQPAPGW